MSGHCECCHVQLVEGAPTPKTPGLCSKCDEAWEAFGSVTPGIQTHILAQALCHSHRDIARRLGCTSTAHYSALSNAHTRTGLGREALIKIATLALLTGRADRPKGFEDLNPIGWQGRSHGNFRPGEASGACDKDVDNISAKVTPPSVGAELPAPIVHCAIEGVEVDEQTFDRAVEDALAQPKAVDKEHVVIDRAWLNAKRHEAIEAIGRHSKRFDDATAALHRDMLDDTSLDAVPALLRVAFKYGRALGQSEALEAIAK